jgi:hypothetical protein
MEESSTELTWTVIKKIKKKLKKKKKIKKGKN